MARFTTVEVKIPTPKVASAKGTPSTDLSLKDKTTWTMIVGVGVAVAQQIWGTKVGQEVSAAGAVLIVSVGLIVKHSYAGAIQALLSGAEGVVGDVEGAKSPVSSQPIPVTPAS